MSDLGVLLRDGGALLLAWRFVTSEMPKARATMDAHGRILAAIAERLGVAVPPVLPPSPPLALAAPEPSPMRRLARMLGLPLLLLGVLLSSGCAAADGALTATKRGLCAAGNTVALGTAILCGEPDPMTPAGHAALAPSSAPATMARATMAEPSTAAPAPVVVNVFGAGARPEAPAEPETTNAAFGAVDACPGGTCGVRHPVETDSGGTVPYRNGFRFSGAPPR